MRRRNLFQPQVTLNSESVTTTSISANQPLVKKRTQFLNPLRIDWRIKYKKDGVQKTEKLGKSKHQVYVTYGDSSKSEELGHVYLSLLHWAVSNDGATNPKQVVWNTWQHFDRLNLTTWDGRKLRYYPNQKPNDLEEGIKACLLHQSGYTECTEFADLLSQSLLVNKISHSLVDIGIDGGGRMMVKNWAVKTKVSFPGEDYPLKLSLLKHTATTILGSMVSQLERRLRSTETSLTRLVLPAKM